LDPRRGAKERNTVRASGKKCTKTALLSDTLVYRRRWGNRIVRENGVIPGIYCYVQKEIVLQSI
jgi:hypothetical protein